MKYSKFSAIIVGSGIAGLYAALKIEQQLNLPNGVLLITKSKLGENKEVGRALTHTSLQAPFIHITLPHSNVKASTYRKLCTHRESRHRLERRLLCNNR